MTDVKIPKWVRRVERGESKLTTDLEKAYRRSDQALWLRVLFFAMWAIGGLVQVWKHAHHENPGRLTEVVFVLACCVLLLGTVVGTEQRWIASVVLRARTPGGPGLQWVAQQAPIRRWHWYRLPSTVVLVVAFIAVWPVTHSLDRHPNLTRLEIEDYEQVALFCCYALFSATVLRRVNRKCFQAARDALLAAEADLVQEPAAGATTAGTG